MVQLIYPPLLPHSEQVMRGSISPSFWQKPHSSSLLGRRFFLTVFEDGRSVSSGGINNSGGGGANGSP